MIVIIIAAGQAKRLRPLTETRLKGSLPILNEPLLVRMADSIEKSGILDKLVLVVSPGQVDEMKSLFLEKSYASKVEVTIQDPPQGTADAVAQGEKFVGDAKQILAMNGDILTPLNEILPNMIKHHNKLDAKCSVLVFPGKSKRYGQLKVTEDGRVLGISEKAAVNELDDDQGYINAGVYLFDREIFDIIRDTPLSARGEYEITDSIALFGKKGPIGAFITNSWMSIENPIDLFNAQSFLTPSEELLCMQFHSGGEIGFKAAEDIFFDNEAEIEFSSVKITGPVLIGKGSLIVTGSQLGPRVFIGRDCEVGANSVLKDALIMNKCRIEQRCELNSITLGEETIIGAGTKITPIQLTEKVLSNPRDRDKLEEFAVIGGKTIIGTNVSITKGVKIPSHSAHTSKDKI